MLLALWGAHPDALAADFRRFYGDSPRGLLAAGVSLLEVAGCARWLPPDAAVWRAYSPPEPDDVWGLTEQLLALVADRLGAIAYVQQRRAGIKSAKPQPIPRPGVTPEVDTTTFGAQPLPLDEMTTWLGWDDNGGGGSDH